MIRASMGWLVWVGLGPALGSCVEPPGAARIIGPDGTQMLHVHCAEEQAACFQLAGERCPRGYDLSPIFDPRDGNFLVRCRDRQTEGAVVISNNPPLPRAPTSRASTEADRWPPAEVATPMEPWPATSSSSAPATPPPQSANGTVDIGY